MAEMEVEALGSVEDDEEDDSDEDTEEDDEEVDQTTDTDFNASAQYASGAVTS